jgi:hypothetical protein
MPTAKQLIEAFPRDLTLHQARELAKQMNQARGNRRGVDDVLAVIDRAINAHGVEAITGDHYVDGFYHNIVALYVNTGDTYNTTVLYATEPERWYIGSWGDWVEKNERKYKIG